MSDFLFILGMTLLWLGIWGIVIQLFLLLDLLGRLMRQIGREIVTKQFDAGLDTGFLDAGVSANVTPEKGFAGHVDINAQPNANAAVSGVAGAAAYTWLAGLAGPWTPFLLLGAGGAWLLARHVKQVKAAKG